MLFLLRKSSFLLLVNSCFYRRSLLLGEIKFCHPSPTLTSGHSDTPGRHWGYREGLKLDSIVTTHKSTSSAFSLLVACDLPVTQRILEIEMFCKQLFEGDLNLKIKKSNLFYRLRCFANSCLKEIWPQVLKVKSLLPTDFTIDFIFLRFQNISLKVELSNKDINIIEEIKKTEYRPSISVQDGAEGRLVALRRPLHWR